ncbi:hypothetical protein [Kutzneria sp. CA-103260]|uniref:hypothetical protein n=1 Tax=Kutzneria sp. CA-103260 TaxID=2802641 RepID=UPI001BAA0FBD|nr:hypothetical protein [Kutzneria sp. CA-103260]QUQ63142.1 hypothetical protein JJ691_08540 [Kutzneria sp. CA-103260]
MSTGTPIFDQLAAASGLRWVMLPDGRIKVALGEPRQQEPTPEPAAPAHHSQVP